MKVLLSQLGTKTPLLSPLYEALFGGKSPLLRPLITYKPPILGIPMQQKSIFSRSSSDHKLYVDPIGGGIGWNLMMQAKHSQPLGQPSRTNTAFGHNEDDAQYRARIEDNVLKLAKELHENPNAPFIVCQEAPIGENFKYFKNLLEQHLPEHWLLERLYVDNTEWGVVTLINRDKVGCELIERLDLTGGISVGQLDARCRTFKLTVEGREDRFLTNIHLPHQSPEIACKGLLYNVIKHKMTQKGDKTGSHVICGDWNIEFDALSEIINQVLAEIQSEEEHFDQEHPVSIKITFFCSPEGHLKADGSKLSVDGALLVSFKRSSKYEYSFNWEPFEKGSATLLGIIIVSSLGMLFIEKEKEEQEEDVQADLPSDETNNPSAHFKKRLIATKSDENQEKPHNKP